VLAVLPLERWDSRLRIERLLVMARKNGKPWYKEGLLFECTQCGECCTGASGLVAFTHREAKGMAKQLDMAVDDFLGKYAKPSHEEGVWEMLELESPHGFDCVLLERCEETGVTRCIAHHARPSQCRTWPFWPDNLKNPKSWDRAARSCEGIGSGRLVPLRVIQRDVEETPDWGLCR
jgi:Fe-S-cluster containining protein